MIPAALMPEGYAQTLQDIRAAIETRLLGMRMSITPTFHRGQPDAGAMPDLPQGAVHVWLDWTGIRRDDDEPNEATMLVSIWPIAIVGKDEGNDQFGQEAPAVERVWGDVLTTLTEELVDIGLDGTCDFVPTPETEHLRGNLSSGDQRVETILMTLEVHHSQQMFRENPE